MFVDDIKIFRTVNNQVEADLLKIDLNALYEWRINNNLTLFFLYLFIDTMY